MIQCSKCGSAISESSSICPKCQSVVELKRVQEKIDVVGRKIVGGLEDVANAEREGAKEIATEIDSAAATIDAGLRTGFQGLIEQFEYQSDLLTNIGTILENPQQIRANELRQMADTLRKRDDVKKAGEFYAQSLELNPLEYKTYIGLAANALRKSDLVEAKSWLEQSLRHAPCTGKGETAFNWKSHAYQLLAHVSTKEEEHDAAAKHLSSAIDLTPMYLEAWYDLTHCFARAGRKKETVETLRSAIIINPTFFEEAEHDDFGGAQKVVTKALRDLSVESVGNLETEIKKLNDSLNSFLPLIGEVEKAQQVANEKGITDSRKSYQDVQDHINTLETICNKQNYQETIDAASLVEKTRSLIGSLARTVETDKTHYRDIRQKKVGKALRAIPAAIIGFPIVFGLGGLVAGYITSIAAVSNQGVNLQSSEAVRIGSPYLYYGIGAGIVTGLIAGFFYIKNKLK